MPVLLLFILMLSMMAMRVYMPFGAKVAGKPVRTVMLSLPERALLQRINMYAIGGVLLLMVLTGIVATSAELIVVVLSLAILSMPVRCLMTSEGIAINNVVYRPWNDFVGFRLEPRRVVLLAREGMRPLSVPLLAAHQKDVLPILRRHLSEVKHGKEARGHKRVAVG